MRDSQEDIDHNVAEHRAISATGLDPRRATYGNINNKFTNLDVPEILDYVLHKPNSFHTLSWTTSFEIPESEYVTHVTRKQLNQLFNNMKDMYPTLKEKLKLKLVAQQFETISISDHSPIISNIHVQQWFQYTNNFTNKTPVQDLETIPGCEITF